MEYVMLGIVIESLEVVIVEEVQCIPSSEYQFL